MSARTSIRSITVRRTSRSCHRLSITVSFRRDGLISGIITPRTTLIRNPTIRRTSSRLPFVRRYVMSKRTHIIACITMITILTSMRCISSVYASRFCHNAFISMPFRGYIFRISMCGIVSTSIRSNTAYRTSRVCCNFTCIIMSDCGYMIILIRIPTSATSMCRITVFRTRRNNHNFIIIMPYCRLFVIFIRITAKRTSIRSVSIGRTRR